ncbi:zonular occludens toxin domain-containing protein [Pseudoxanthomonas putridarboris]|uniref:Zonular occludens toxin domain-containing protein n=1 Tax=Pseudoxanthomonas putridarboris TaxID=752605 RepID=A0ABU9IZL6_9GAMM
MIYWYTGQPGHGKTLHAIERLLEFKDQGRMVYACNIREFDYAKAGVLEMTPEDFKHWPEFLPDGAVALVDEAYEHGMLPKRPAGSKVPNHVEQLAKHRHRGLDFIFVSQSPDKQCDQFVQDLIERHIHVRRRFGTQFVHLREFDRYEAQAEKATPLVVRRKRLPKRPRGLYRSTEMDTTERKIPWYYIGLPLAVVLGLGLMYYTFGNMGDRLGGGSSSVQPSAKPDTVLVDQRSASGSFRGAATTAAEYARAFLPRVASEPWSAPVYDDALHVPGEPPRLFCMSSLAGANDRGEHVEPSCTCLTEQGTHYVVQHALCRFIARRGQYEPYRDERNSRWVDGPTQIDRAHESIARRESGGVIVPGSMAEVGETKNVVRAAPPHF